MRGLTLVEALVGMGLLTVVALLILTLLPKTLAQQRQLSTRAMVVHKADHELNQALSRKPLLTVGDYPIEKLTLSDGTEIAGQLKVSQTSIASVREFQVTLQWQERGAKRDFVQKKRVADVTK